MAHPSVLDPRAESALTRRYDQGESYSQGSTDFAREYPVFKQYGITGNARYTPSLRGDKYGRVYTYSPEEITTQEYDEMRFDAQIRAGLMLIKLPIMRSNWSIKCQDEQIGALVTEALKPCFKQLLRDVLLSLDFGYSSGELIWKKDYNVTITETQAQLNSKQEKTYPYIVRPDRMMMFDPLTIYLLAYRRSGLFAGVKQFTPQDVLIPANKCLHFANEMEFQELHGVARTKAAYPFWFFKKSMYEWTNVHFETFAEPTKVGYYPEGNIEIGMDALGNGVTEPAMDHMLELLNGLANNNSVALPNGLMQDKDMRQWSIDYLESNKGGDQFINYIDHLNAQTLKALLIPELALEVGASGSYALAEEQINFFMIGIEGLMEQIAEALTTQVVDRIVRYNFGLGAPHAEFGFDPLEKSLRQGLQDQLLQTVGSNQPVPLADGSMMLPDWQKIADNLHVPVKVLQEEDLATFRAGQTANMEAEGFGQNPAAGGGEGQFGGGGAEDDMPFGKPPPDGGGDSEPPDEDDEEALEATEHWEYKDGLMVLSDG
jgi:hypothetical protein